MEQHPTKYQPTGSYLTTNEQILSAYKTTPIRNLGQNYDPIKRALIQVFNLMGLKAQNYPGTSEMMTIVEFIREKLGGFAPDDIRIAFTMAIAGELNIDLKKLDHFQSFNCIYLMHVMMAYKAHKQAVVAEHERKRIEDQFKTVELSDEEKKAKDEHFFKVMVLDEVEKFKKSGEMPEIHQASAKYIYKSILDRGLIRWNPRQKVAIYHEEEKKVMANPEYKRPRGSGPITLSENLAPEQKEMVKVRFWIRGIKETFTWMRDEDFQYVTNKPQ